MKKYFSFLGLILFFGSVYGQQRFRPYSTFGIESSVVFSKMPSDSYLTFGGVLAGPYSPNLEDFSTVIELKGAFDYAPYRILGVGTGLGLTIKGGGGKNGLFLYYLNLPVKAQLKAGFLWFEPSLQTNILIGSNNLTNRDYYWDENTINTIYLSYGLMLRFNLFKGLSLHAGTERALTNAAHVKYPFPYDPGSYTKYKQVGYLLGFRYMFNQPPRIRN